MDGSQKKKTRTQKFKEVGDSRYIYRNELNKGYLQHDMIYESFKDLSRRTVSDKVLHGKAFRVASDPMCDRYQRGFAWMVYKFFNINSRNTNDHKETGIISEDQELISWWIT